MRVISERGNLLNLDRANYLGIVYYPLTEDHEELYNVVAQYSRDCEHIKSFPTEKEAYAFIRELALWMLEGYKTSTPCFRIDHDEHSTSATPDQGQVEELAPSEQHG